MSAEEYIFFGCTKLTQPIGVCYVGVINARDLLRIACADVRRIEARGVEKYLGIERPLSPTRVKELKQYVRTIDATFPTSIILSVSSTDAVYDEDTNTMRITDDEKVAHIIDGQHRIAGLEGYEDKEFQLNVTLFIDMELEDQAMVFATINLKQTKVSKSLVYDLYEFAKSRSPQKTCHNIARLLNKIEDSPFKDKIKILGVATGEPQETITQARFVDDLMKLITDDPMRDRDSIKRGKKPEKAKEIDLDRLVFRNLFLEEKDVIIARTVWNYFKAVEGRWPRAWLEVKQGNILNRSNGFSALMRFLPLVYSKICKPDEVPSIKRFGSVFEMIDLKEDEFNSNNYKPGTSGEKGLFEDLKKKSVMFKS